MTEHAWTWEQRTIRQRTPLDPTATVDQSRLVCACGFATKWRSAAYIAKREADRHALDGQQSLV